MTSSKDVIALDKTFKQISLRWDAIEIIKKKNVSVAALKLGADLETYNMWWTAGEEHWLTQEEYDLLKEVLL